MAQPLQKLRTTDTRTKIPTSKEETEMKKRSTKLTLKKETVCKLATAQLGGVAGGYGRRTHIATHCDPFGHAIVPYKR